MKNTIISLYGCKDVYGPYVGDDGRKRMVLYYADQSTSSVAYARVLLSVKLGRLLTDDEEADHKNNDNTDDRIDNLQVLTREENLLKERWHYIVNVQELYGFVCANCETPFLITHRDLMNKLNQTKDGLAFCSRRCSAQYKVAAGTYGKPK
jgi:hypothetical protein